MMKVVLRFVVPVVALIIGCAVMLPAAGCGSNAPPPGPASVRGRVMFNGRPVVGGMVVFAPDPQHGCSGKPAHAETGPDGGFTLQLGASPHIPAGWYRVALAPPPGAPRGPVFPAKLARPDLSGLEREVQAGQNHVFEFTVTVPE